MNKFMRDFGYSMLWYWGAYLFVTAIGVLHTVYNAFSRGMGVMIPGERKPMNEIESYAKTMPWHPLYNLIMFPLFAAFYLAGLEAPTLSDALVTGGIWVAITAVFDLVGWVLVPHPWHCTFKDFYVDYQPWITMIYLVIFASPVLAYYILQLL